MNAIDEVKERAGIEDALLSHHTGRYEQTEGEDVDDRAWEEEFQLD